MRIDLLVHLKPNDFFYIFTHLWCVLLCFILRAKIHENPSSRRPRAVDTRNAAAEIGNPDLFESRRPIPCCEIGVGKDLAPVVTAPEEPL